VGELQPDIAGHIASLDTTDDPWQLCDSCQRALIYGAMMYAGSIKGELADANKAIKDGDAPGGVKALRAATHHAGVLVELLAEFVKADFIACLPGAEDLDPDDWAMAMSSFFEARTTHYVSPDGKLIFEPHEPEDGEPVEVGS